MRHARGADILVSQRTAIVGAVRSPDAAERAARSSDFRSSTSPPCSRASPSTLRSTASRSSISGVGIPRLGRLSTSSTRCAAAANDPPRTGIRRFAGCLRCARRSRLATPRSTGSSSTRDSEVTIVPGTKTAICELALVLAERGSTIVLPDPYYPDYPSGPALAGGSAPATCRSTAAPAGRPTSARRPARTSPPSS